MCVLFGIISPSISYAKAPVESFLEMRHKNVVIQNWDLSCGAAALTTLLNYQHGFSLTEKEVATALISRDEYIKDPSIVAHNHGFSLSDLDRYVEKLGLIGTGLGQLTFSDLLYKAPILLPINLEGFNHFVVFRGISKNQVLLADPAWGNRILKKAVFDKAWIKFGKIGRVGFTVTSKNPETQKKILFPNTNDFVLLR